MRRMARHMARHGRARSGRGRSSAKRDAIWCTHLETILVVLPRVVGQVRHHHIGRRARSHDVDSSTKSGSLPPLITPSQARLCRHAEHEATPALSTPSRMAHHRRQLDGCHCGPNCEQSGTAPLCALAPSALQRFALGSIAVGTRSFKQTSWGGRAAELAELAWLGRGFGVGRSSWQPSWEPSCRDRRTGVGERIPWPQHVVGHAARRIEA